MRIFRKTHRIALLSFVLLLMGSFLLLSCSKDEDLEPEKTEEPNQEKPSQDGEMILGERTILLDSEFIQHVKEPAIESRILLDGSIDESDLPQLGDILLNIDASDNFPYGFLGKVTEINKTGDGYSINTEKAYLDETFDKLYIEDEMVVTTYEPPTPKTRGTLGIDSLTFEMNDYSEADCTGKQFSLTIPMDIKLDVGIALKFSYKIDIDKESHDPIFDFTLKNAWKCACTTDINIEGSKSSSIPLGQLSFGKLSPVGGIAHVLFRPRIEISAFASAQGKIDFEFSKTNSSISSFSFNNQGGTPHMSPAIEQEQTTRVTSSKVGMDGTLFAGLQCSFIAYALNEKLASIQIPFSIGPWVSADFSYDMITSTPYESLADAKISVEGLHYSIAARCSLFKFFSEKEKEDNDDKGDFHEYYIPFGPYENHIGDKKEYGIFPKFNNLEAKRMIADQTQAAVASTVTNDLLIPVEIDYNLYDENDTKLSVEREWRPYYREEEMNNPLMKNINGLEPSKTYFVRPTVNFPLFGEIEAEPSAEIEPDITVTTEGSSSRNKTLMLFGSFDPELQSHYLISGYGICYDTSGNPSLSSTSIAASGNDEGNFQVMFSAQENVTYYYRAYLVIDGTVYYGAIKEAELEQDNSIIGHWKFINARSVGDYGDESLGVFGDFIINANGTCSLLFDSEHISGKWSLGNGHIIIRYDEEDEITLAFSIKTLTETNLTTYIYTTSGEQEGHDSGIYTYYERKDVE